MLKYTRLFLISLVVVLALIVLPEALAQTKPEDQERPAQFRAIVDQVVLYAAVYDMNGELVTNLQKDEFKVYEDKVLQNVTYFGLDDVPSTIGIVLDKSGSMRAKMDLVSEATELFLTMTNPENELFLVAFDDEASLEEPFTRDVEDIRDGLFNLIVSGGTALYDAIYLAVDQAQSGSEPKKAVVVFTDGEDKDSYYTHEELLDKVQESDVQVYVVAFLAEDLSDEGGFFGVFKSEREKVTKVLTTIADDTGAKAFFPKKITDLSEVFKTIAQELRNQYRLAYVSSNAASEENWRTIKVEVDKARERGLRVRAKKGYFAKK